MLVWNCPVCGKVNASRIDLNPIDFGKPKLNVVYVRRLTYRCLSCGEGVARFRMTLVVRQNGGEEGRRNG